MTWRIRELPIRRKLAIVAMVACAATLLVAVGGSFAYDHFAVRKRMVEELRALGDVVGTASSAALSFEDERVAEQILKGLSGRPSIVAAALYDRAGDVLAEYHREGTVSVVPSRAPRTTEQWTATALAVSVPVQINGDRIGGVVYIEEDLSALQNRLRVSLALAAILVPLSLLLVSLLSRPLHRPIAEPILELARVTRRVSSDQDYSIRAVATSGDEIGLLIDGFNDMLAQLETRDRRLAQHSGQLEDEVSKRTSELRRVNSELRAAKESADAANLAKTQFVANVSHELRTPITGVLGMTHLLSCSQLTDEQQEWLSLVTQSAETLLSLIDDLLDFSRIEAGRMPIESVPFSPREEIQTAIKLLMHQAEHKGLTIESDIASDVPDAVIGDPVRFKQVITNLLGNAVKFTAHGSVRVGLSISTTGNADVELHGEVADTGIGIAMDRQEAIFQPFTQGDSSTTRRFGGSGLGLAICARLLAMMGGRVWVVSAPGQGSTFHFTVRTKRAAGPAVVRREPAPAVELPPLVILCAEDSPINQRITSELLMRAGHEVDLAQSGSEAVALVARRRYDVVLMDLQMPEMDGFTATAAIRESERDSGHHVPIVALTAHAMESDKARCMAAGMDGYLSKPFRPADLMKAIATALPGRRSVPRTHHVSLTSLLADELNHLLVIEYESKLKEIGAAVAGGRLGEVRALVHRLKAAMALFHTGEPYSAADRLEMASAAADRPGAAEAWTLLEQHLERLLADLQRT